MKQMKSSSPTRVEGGPLKVEFGPHNTCGDIQGLQKAGLGDRMIKLVMIQVCRFPVFLKQQFRA